MAWPVLGERHFQNASGRGASVPVEQPRIVQAWPVLGAKRAKAADEAKNQTEAEPPAKKRKTRQEHDILKFDTVLRGKGLPLEVQALVKEYAALPEQFERYKQQYGSIVANYEGWCCSNGSHDLNCNWLVFQWVLFSVPQSVSLRGVHGVIQKCTRQSLEQLKDKQIKMVYKNAAGHVTNMYPKVVKEVLEDRLILQNGQMLFPVMYTRILHIRLFVGVRR